MVLNSYDKFEAKASIMNLVLNLCRARRTGTLFLTTDQNHMATLVLQAGKIIALQYRNKRGLQAIPMLNNINKASFKFDEGLQMFNLQEDLPSTGAILRQLGINITTTSQSKAGTAEAQDHDRVDLISEENQALVIKTLAKYVGPLAGIACQNVFGQVARLDDALLMLSEQMPDASLAEKFLKEVNEAL